MRHTINTSGATSQRLDPGARPPLELLPKALADKLRERDKLATARNEARQAVNALAPISLDSAAKAEDDKSAADAARAGKPIPPAAAVPKLAADRVNALRALEATESAFLDVTNECETLASDLYWAAEDTREADRAKKQEALRKQAAKLADAVEASADSVDAWLRGNAYDTNVNTWAVDVLPQLASRGFTRGGSADVGPVNVRDLIIRAATTTLDKEEN